MAAFSHLLVRAYGDGEPNPQYTTATLSVTFDNPNIDTGNANDSFGYSVALSGTRVFIGARDEDVGVLTDTGKAYAYNGSTTQTYVFNNPSDGTPDYYGAAVAVENSIYVVGAPGDDDPETDSGKVYLYDVSGGLDRGEGTPTLPIHTFNNPNGGAIAGGTAANDQFGYSVALSGKYMVAGAPTEDTPGVGSTDGGRAYIFDTDTKNLIQTLTQPSPGNNEFFGTSVAIDGARTVVGAPGRTNDAGAAYVYDTTSGLLLYTFNNPNAPANTANDNFGHSVAISGRYVIVGAHNEDAGLNLSTGVAYVYDLNSATPLTPVFTLYNPDTVAGQNDYFGYSVSISGIYAVVGAYGQDTNTGIAYVYKLEDNVTPESAIGTIVNPNATQNDFFGDKVLISGNQVLIGARGANKVYQYTLS